MKIINNSNENQMILRWLHSELYRMKDSLQSSELNLIEQANLSNDGENQARKNLLFYRYGRSAILNKIPPISEWLEVILEESDMDKLYILPVFDWFLDTGGTFRLIDMLKHLASGRGYELNSQPPQRVVHYEKINYMLKNPPADIDGIVIITTDIKKGLFTIIDGTHRASMLIKQGKLIGVKAYVGVSLNLSNCFWSIERTDIKQHLSNLKQLVDSRKMW